MSDGLRKLNIDEKIVGMEDVTVADFWSWAYSDILSNRNRSVFAEFLVGQALGVIDTPRIEWDAFDLIYQGKKIEVKSSAYLQSWQQSKDSLISFDVAMKRGWYADTNTFEVEPIRAADCYVFCLFRARDRLAANILDIGSWRFYVLATDQINRDFGSQKRVGLKAVEARCQPLEYNSLKAAIDQILGV